MLKPKPYFLNNKEWYIEIEDLPSFLGGTNEKRYQLTDKAPKEAIDSYNEFYKDLENDIEIKEEPKDTEK